jgi:methionine--tRNA ligase beta chain
MPTTEQVAGIFISDIIPLMTIDEFQKMDLRVGKIISAERVEGSEKLLKLQVDIGEIRQILSGIAKTHAPEELVGREVVIIANLDPRMMMGMESQGMILAAHGENGEPVILVPEHEVPSGSKIT